MVEPGIVEILSREELHRGFFRLARVTASFQRFDGSMSDPVRFEVVERGAAVTVVLYDPARDEVVLIRQFRPGSYLADGRGWNFEIVAGGCDGATDFHAVARREVREETGLEVISLRHVFRYFVSASGSTETVHLFLGIVDSANPPTSGGLAHENEDIQVVALPFAAAWELLESGAINSAPAIMGLQWLAMHRVDFA